MNHEHIYNHYQVLCTLVHNVHAKLGYDRQCSSFACTIIITNT
jgi:hypothetical protein